MAPAGSSKCLSSSEALFLRCSCSAQAALHRRQGTCLVIDDSRRSQVALPLPSSCTHLLLQHWMQMAGEMGYKFELQTVLRAKKEIRATSSIYLCFIKAGIVLIHRSNYLWQHGTLKVLQVMSRLIHLPNLPISIGLLL